MTCIFPVFAGDVFLLFNQLRWIEQLGGAHGHHAIICADAGLDWHLCNRAVALAEKSFDSVSVITNADGSPQGVPGWIPGSNSLWVAAAKFCQANQIDGWLWMEPDTVPLKKGWLDALENEYGEAPGLFHAAVYPCTQIGLPPSMVSGIAVYPVDAIRWYGQTNEAFDVTLSRALQPSTGSVNQVYHSRLVQHFWGLPGLPPTFRNTKIFSPRHAFTLEKLSPDAVLFHRQKDGTLIELLRAKMGIGGASVPASRPFIVVLPVCLKDADLMLKCLNWMVELDGQNQFDCLISHDPTLGPAWMQRLKEVAARAFRSVSEFIYPRPVRENWPDACNVAFQSTAQHIQAHHHRPWLWLEPDCVPLKPDWLPSLWQEYQNCDLPIAGPVIEGVGHMNGTAIYPENFGTLSPDAMRATSQAWDTAMTYDIVGKVHDIGRLFCHRWGMIDGKLHQSQGPAPHFASPLAVALVPKDAVLFHRCKDGSLIEQLRKLKK